MSVGRGGDDPDLSVIVVSWNTRDLTLTALRRVVERSAGLRVQLILVDNASSDGTPAAVRDAFEGIEVVELPGNLGFPRANNHGLLRARGRHVLFLNPDTEVGEGTLEACVRELDTHPELGAVGCRLLLPDGRTQPECARRDYRLPHLIWEGLYLHVLFPEHPVFAHQTMGDFDRETDREVEALSGACLMVRASALSEVGGMPDEVFMYHEDLALCLRLRKRGWRLRYLAGVSTLHHHRASTVRSTSPVELLEGEVRVRLIEERSGPLWGVLARWLFGVRSVCRLLIALLTVALPPLRLRYPQATDVGKQAALLAWTFAPGTVRRRLRESGIPVDERPGLLIVGPTPPPVHGVSVYTQMLLSSPELRTRFRVSHVDLADRRDLDNTGRLDPINVLLGLRHLAETWRAGRREGPDLCWLALSQNPLAFGRDALLIAAARLGGARVVAQVHGGRLDDLYRQSPSAFQRVMKTTAGWIHRGWVLGDGLRRLFDDLLPPDRIRVVPNGVAAPVAGEGAVPGGVAKESEGDSAGSREADVLRVLYLGQVGLAKGVDDLVRAVRLVAGSDRRVRCVVAGAYRTAEDRHALEPALVELERRGLGGAVGVVRGSAREAAFADADVLALPSRDDGQPLVVLEAMARGLPVIATRQGAIPDMVVHGETGLLVPEGAAGALAGALERLHDRPRERRALGCAGRRRWEEHFTRERCLERVIEEFEHALR